MRIKLKAKQPPLSMRAALTWIFFSALLISGSAAVGLYVYDQVQESRLHDDTYLVRKIVQTGPNWETLPTNFLAQVLDLSVDHPVNLYAFDTEWAARQMEALPMVRAARLEKILPDTLYIDYTLRHPVALLYDESNLALDREGYAFPIAPFFTPKVLPEIYLGLIEEGEEQERESVQGKGVLKLKIDFALKVLDEFSKEEGVFELKRIDVSNSFAKSAGDRQLLLLIEERIQIASGGGESEDVGKVSTFLCPRLLRLRERGYHDGLRRYKLMRERLVQMQAEELPVGEGSLVRVDPLVVELRLDRLAYVSGLKAGVRKEGPRII